MKKRYLILGLLCLALVSCGINTEKEDEPIKLDLENANDATEEEVTTEEEVPDALKCYRPW